jgi:hypothetical protein
MPDTLKIYLPSIARNFQTDVKHSYNQQTTAYKKKIKKQIQDVTRKLRKKTLGKDV